MKRFCICSLSSHLDVLTFFLPNRGMLRRSRCVLIFLEITTYIHTPSSHQSRVYRVTQLRTDGVHCRESIGKGPAVLKVVPVTGAAFSGLTIWTNECPPLFSHTHYGVGGYAAARLLLSSFPCSADHERDWPPCKAVFSGWRPIR